MVRQLEGEQEFAVDVGEQGKADHGERLQLSDGNKTQRRWHVGQSEDYFNSKQQTIFYFSVRVPSIKLIYAGLHEKSSLR